MANVGRYQSHFSPEADQFREENKQKIKEALQPILSKVLKQGFNSYEEQFTFVEKEIVSLMPGFKRFSHDFLENEVANMLLHLNCKCHAVFRSTVTRELQASKE